MRLLVVFLALVLSTASTAPAPVAGQLVPSTDPGRSVRTRADLERLLTEYDAALASPAYSDGVKRSIRADADRIRGRLRDGDFRVGDRVYISVQGELNYPDTVVVEPGPMIVLQSFGEVSLAGVLRSEITDHLTTALGRFIRTPVVRAQGLMRVSVLGDVGQPGFYTMPAETLLGDVLMMAGGPGANAVLDELRIERAGQPLYEEEAVQEALRAGLTLDQLNLEAGDQIFLPTATTRNFLGTIMPIIGAIGTLSFLLFQVF
jgi:protein involved in polysaccharide export with SLBB domain